jgi:hypothetical protein
MPGLVHAAGEANAVVGKTVTWHQRLSVGEVGCCLFWTFVCEAVSAVRYVAASGGRWLGSCAHSLPATPGPETISGSAETMAAGAEARDEMEG